jgi:hypothetical protein
LERLSKTKLTLIITLRKQTFQTIIRKVATYGKFISSDNKRALTLPTEMVLKGKKKKGLPFLIGSLLSIILAGLENKSGSFLG